MKPATNNPNNEYFVQAAIIHLNVGQFEQVVSPKIIYMIERILLSFFIFFTSQFALAQKSNADIPPSAFKIDKSECEKDVNALSSLVGMAKSCKWSNGTREISAPSAFKNFCYDKEHGLSKQKFCSGQVTCLAGGASVSFPSVICRAEDGECDADKCLEDFAFVYSESCSPIYNKVMPHTPTDPEREFGKDFKSKRLKLEGAK